jgi:2-polyprenyl-6-methoxyphenol hydroxylase-like FAD-dependent oxidoreductase
MSTPFKVAIVGGGMTGLVAALTLDRVGIDFFLVEAYPDVNPDVGASIALYPNFQRVLDQLGVLDHVLAESEELCTLSCRDGNGRPMYTHHVAEAIHAQTGYGIATFKRSQLLRILHENLSAEGKAKVHGSQRVTRIEELPGDEEGVRLHFEGGQTRDADVVIGADGTHSIVRSEMWRLAQQTDPKAFIGDQREGEKYCQPRSPFGSPHIMGTVI